jgi:hypothetical protein
MRIPSSAIVMSVLAAVPFGLAIRDEVTHHDPQHEREARVQAAEAEAHAAAEAERTTEAEYERQLATEAAARDAARRDAAQQLIGAGFVTPGPAFEGLTLGGAWTEHAAASAEHIAATDEHAAAAAAMGEHAAAMGEHAAAMGEHAAAMGEHTAAMGERAAPTAEHADHAVVAAANATPDDIAVTSDAAGKVLAMALAFDDDEGCTTLATAAARTWGEPDHAHVWLDLASGHRAAIRSDCTLELARFESPAAWVAHLPLDAVGAARAKIARRYVPAEAEADETWPAPGLDGDALATVWPNFDVARPDTLVGIVISAPATPRTQELVIEALSARLHAKPTRDDDGVYHWPRGVELDRSDDQVRVSIFAAE